MKIWKSLLAMGLILLLCLGMTACTATPADNSGDTSTTKTETGIPADGAVLGEGAHTFTFQVVNKDKSTLTYTIHTDADNVGAALLENNLITGDKGDYGLFVTAVLGVSLDYNKDGYWWALSENGKDSMVAVDGLAITDGSTYAFTATPAA